MHELSICQGLLDLVNEEVGKMSPVPSRVLEVRMVAGVLRQIVPEFMQEAFGFLAAGTSLEDARLTIRVCPMQVTCVDCSATADCIEIPGGCPSCGSRRVSIQGGSELFLESLEVDD